MPMQSDIARVQNQKLRHRQRMEGETNLKKNVADPHDDDLAATVMANREKAGQKEKIDQLKRNR